MRALDTWRLLAARWHEVPSFIAKRVARVFFFPKHSWILFFTVCACSFERERDREGGREEYRLRNVRSRN